MTFKELYLRRLVYVASETLRYIAHRENRPNWIEPAQDAAKSALRVMDNPELLEHYTQSMALD